MRTNATKGVGVTIRILFAGRKKVSVECLEWLVREGGYEVVGVLTDNHLEISPTANVASSLGIPVLSHRDIDRLVAEGAIDFDLVISMLYWRKIRGSLLDHPRLGVINFHPAPLPEYKGCGGYNLAILEGLDQWAVSAHYIDDEIDTGALIEVRSFPFDTESATVVDLECRSQCELYALFVDTMIKIRAGEGRLPTTPNQGGRYVTRNEMEGMKELKPGDDLARKVRAFWFPPYDGAYIEIDGAKYTLVDRTILQGLADPVTSSLFTEASAKRAKGSAANETDKSE